MGSADVKTNLHPLTERLLRGVAESLQAKINALSRQADLEKCPGGRQGIRDEILALHEDKEEILALLA